MSIENDHDENRLMFIEFSFSKIRFIGSYLIVIKNLREKYKNL